MNNKALQKAIKERDAFLKEHPELQSLQTKINEQLEECGNDCTKRMEVISQLIHDKLNQLEGGFEELHDCIALHHDPSKTSDLIDTQRNEIHKIKQLKQNWVTISN